jgi:hypothetical protein
VAKARQEKITPPLQTGKEHGAGQWGIPKMSIADFPKKVSEEGIDLSQF